MPFEILRNDITKMVADAIVNTANPRPVIGEGTDSMIHQAAGPELLMARQRIGNIAPGAAAITPAYALNAKYVIHTVGPVWNGGGYGETQQLRSCYDVSLRLAAEHGCSSIAFPLISTGNYGFPKNKALQIAISAFSEFLLDHEMQIYLVVFDSVSVHFSEKLFQNIASFIDEHYVESYSFPKRERRRREECPWETCAMAEPLPVYPTMAAPKAVSLQDMLRQEDAGFTETLLKRIDKTGKKDSEIYKKANLSKQHFSKIRNNPHYKPTKATALALALALELDLEQTKDLIGRAGYALTNSSKFDLIIRFHIENQIYNVMEINLALYEFDQPLLGA